MYLTALVNAVIQFLEIVKTRMATLYKHSEYLNEVASFSTFQLNYELVNVFTASWKRVAVSVMLLE